jgi:hypothetical protein
MAGSPKLAFEVTSAASPPATRHSHGLSTGGTDLNALLNDDPPNWVPDDKKVGRSDWPVFFHFVLY